jgi:hypothetical protein
MVKDKPSLISLPKFLDPRGNLSFFESSDQIPFEIKRTYLIYDVPGGEAREGHAYHNQREFIVALSGSFEVKIVDQSGTKSNYILNKSYFGLYLPNLVWRQIENFSTNSVCLVACSTLYESDDYIRDFSEFQKYSI